MEIKQIVILVASLFLGSFVVVAMIAEILKSYKKTGYEEWKSSFFLISSAILFFLIPRPSDTKFQFTFLRIALTIIFIICFWLTMINASKLAQKYIGNKPAGNMLRIIFASIFVVIYILSVFYMLATFRFKETLDCCGISTGTHP